MPIPCQALLQQRALKLLRLFPLTGRPVGAISARPGSSCRGPARLKQFLTAAARFSPQLRHEGRDMRVDGNRPIRPAATRRDDRAGVGGTGSFAEALGAEQATAPSVAAPAI